MSDRMFDSSDMNAILQRLRQRQRRLNTLDGAARGLLIGGVAAVLLALLGVIAQAPWLVQSPWKVLWCFPVFALLGAAVGAIGRVNDLRIARALDRAAVAGDRFASALQLQDHPRKSRTRLIEQDAFAAVGALPAVRALPYRAPRSLRFVPLTILLAAVIVVVGIGKPSAARALPEPEISPDQWVALQEDFRNELSQLPKPQSAEEKLLHDQLEKLAKSLEREPQKRDVLEEIARLRAELDRRRQSLPGRSMSMQRAAANLRSSQALQPFASQLKSGEFGKAADALEQLAEKLAKDPAAMSAEDFESAAADLDRMANDLNSHPELGNACKQCANAAGAMNRDKLADAFKRFGRTLRKNSDSLKQSDKMCRACDLLDRLKNRMNECESCKSCKDGQCNKPGCSTCNRFVRQSNKKGGMKAGWGTADKWHGGRIGEGSDQRMPNLVEPQRQPGESTSYQVLSKDERAESALDYKQVYAEMVKKAEADLSLESVPLAYRDYLRRYFMAIRPQEDTSPDGGAKPSSP